jgi:glycine/D-amino acid oxidase-like deaminating enzyme
LGATILQRAEVREIKWNECPELQLATGKLRARKVLLATNALSADLTSLRSTIHPKITLAARTSPLSENQIEVVGLAERKPFYTVDFPYLWGRLCLDNSIIWGAGLVDPPEMGDLTQVDVTSDHAQIFERLEARIHGLHPVLANAAFTHLWGGPIAFRASFEPVFSYHSASRDGIVLGVYAGHGVALSVHLGAWAAEVLLGRRELPEWGQIDTENRHSKLW